MEEKPLFMSKVRVKAPVELSPELRQGSYQLSQLISPAEDLDEEDDQDNKHGNTENPGMFADLLARDRWTKEEEVSTLQMDSKRTFSSLRNFGQVNC